MDIVKAGVMLAVYLFVVTAIYIFLSSPFDDVVTGFEDIDLTASDEHLESSGAMIRNVFDMMFVGLAAVPIVWFMVWVFRREPDWYER